jgi:hypothetical protein
MVENGVPVTLYLPKSLVDQLQREAFRRGFTLSQYVRHILSSRPAGEGAKPEERVTASGAPSTSPAADQPERRRPAATQAAAADKQPPRSWRFCPKCLTLFDGGATCPHDGSELVPFEGEGKQLYAKLKAEREAR